MRNDRLFINISGGGSLQVLTAEMHAVGGKINRGNRGYTADIFHDLFIYKNEWRSSLEEKKLHNLTSLGA